MVYYLIFINILCFLLYGIDKRLAIKRKSRIEENVLFFISLIGGCIGAILGMKLFRHKTLKVKFYVINILAIMLWIYLVLKSYIV